MIWFVKMIDRLKRSNGSSTWAWGVEVVDVHRRSCLKHAMVGRATCVFEGSWHGNCPCKLGITGNPKNRYGHFGSSTIITGGCPAAAGKGASCKRPVWRRVDALARVLLARRQWRVEPCLHSPYCRRHASPWCIGAHGRRANVLRAGFWTWPFAWGALGLFLGAVLPVAAGWWTWASRTRRRDTQKRGAKPSKKPWPPRPALRLWNAGRGGNPPPLAPVSQISLAVNPPHVKDTRLSTQWLAS